MALETKSLRIAASDICTNEKDKVLGLLLSDMTTRSVGKPMASRSAVSRKA